MSAIRLFSLFFLAALILAGCNAIPFLSSPEIEVENPMSQLYPLKDGLDLQVSFQNQTTYDASQLGLYMLSRTEERSPAVSVEDADFFPRYFSIINLDIDDGLLFISEDEATSFARAAYLQYQNSVTSKEDLRKFRKTHTLSEVISPRRITSMATGGSR